MGRDSASWVEERGKKEKKKPAEVVPPPLEIDGFPRSSRVSRCRQKSHTVRMVHEYSQRQMVMRFAVVVVVLALQKDGHDARSCRRRPRETPNRYRVK